MPSWIAALCKARPRVADVLDMTVESVVRAAKSTLLSTRWVYVMTLLVTPGNEQDREQVYDLCREVQQVTGDHIDVVIADQGYTGEQPQIDASLNDVELGVTGE